MLHGSVVVFRIVNVMESAQHRHTGRQATARVQNPMNDIFWQTVQQRCFMGIHDACPVVTDENDFFGKFSEQVGQHHVRPAACHGKCNIAAI